VKLNDDPNNDANDDKLCVNGSTSVVMMERMNDDANDDDCV
jgi:hypothetical protein